LYTAFFVYLNLISYAWLNKAFTISRTMLYYLAAAAISMVFIRLFWPGISDMVGKHKLSTLIDLSVAPVFFHFFGRFAVPRVARSMTITTASAQKFQDFFIKFGITFFQRLPPALFMYIQLSLLWTTDNF
jgi:hypothetical protein